jgi:alpha-glucoside transport system substrate-binding protein
LIENLLLAADPGAYDRWISHEIGFDSPAVRTAFERLHTILFSDGYVDGKVAQTNYGGAVYPMVDDDPPGCWLFQGTTFSQDAFRVDQIGTEVDVFPFPPADDGSGNWVLGSGGMLASTDDRPEVREVVRFLLSPEHSAGWAGSNGGISPNRRFDPLNYGNGTWGSFWTSQSKLLRTALDEGRFRFDASDLMPPEVGEGAFWDGMMRYADEGAESLDEILADIDAAWPDDTS